MKLKQRVGDFRVRELLHEGYLRERGAHRVYRVTKRKLTTPEAVRVVADLAGVEPNEVSIAGLKDRQGITIQHVSVPRGRDLRVQDKDLKIDTAGFADEAISSDVSRGNAFEIGVRSLSREDVQRLRGSLPRMREHGVANYFDDQRFGNLEFGQGWIMVDLMRGEPEKALRSLLTGSSERDDERHRRFKDAMDGAWGDWRACRDIAGKFGAHHSIFEHLARTQDDFVGAFDHVATRVKTIHLFAYQSHLWNRAVAELVREATPVEDRVAMPGIEGPLISWAGKVPTGLRSTKSFPLPGAGLDDVKDPKAYSLLEDVLAKERLVPDQLRVEGTSGFHLMGELRPLRVVPEHLRVRPPENDVLNPGAAMVRVRFELPRGAYATLVVKRLLAHRVGDDGEPIATRAEPRAFVPRPRDASDRGRSRGRQGEQGDVWGPKGGDRPRDDQGRRSAGRSGQDRGGQGWRDSGRQDRSRDERGRGDRAGAGRNERSRSSRERDSGFRRGEVYSERDQRQRGSGDRAGWGRPDRGRPDRGRPDRGRDDRGGDDRGRGYRGRPDRSDRSDSGGGRQGGGSPYGRTPYRGQSDRGEGDRRPPDRGRDSGARTGRREGPERSKGPSEGDPWGAARTRKSKRREEGET